MYHYLAFFREFGDSSDDNIFWNWFGSIWSKGMWCLSLLPIFIIESWTTWKFCWNPSNRSDSNIVWSSCKADFLGRLKTPPTLGYYFLDI